MSVNDLADATAELRISTQSSNLESLHPSSPLYPETSPAAIPEYEHHAHRPIGHQDILHTIVDICEAEKAYGTIALLAAISQLHHQLVEPRLRRIRKRVVLDLREYRWEEREKYGNIEIVECSRDTAFPFEQDYRATSEYSPRRTEFRRTLRPDILSWKGQPDTKLIKLWRDLFPSLSIIVCSERSHTLDRSEEEPPPSRYSRKPDEWKKRSDEFAKQFAYEIENVGVHNMFEERTLQFRYRLHQDYDLFSPGRRGQRLFVFRGVDEDRTLEYTQEVSRSDGNEGSRGVITECKRMLPNLHFDTVTYDAYVQFADLQAGSFLYDRIRPCPAGYPALDKKMSKWASKSLQNPDSRFTLRLFVLGHRKAVGDRADMVPIYMATYGRQTRPRGSTRPDEADPDDGSDGEMVGARNARLVDRTTDEDFARCILNNGCVRCRALV